MVDKIARTANSSATGTPGLHESFNERNWASKRSNPKRTVTFNWSEALTCIHCAYAKAITNQTLRIAKQRGCHDAGSPILEIPAL